MTFLRSSLDLSRWWEVVVSTAMSSIVLLKRILTCATGAFGRAALIASFRERGVVVVGIGIPFLVMRSPLVSGGGNRGVGGWFGGLGGLPAGYRGPGLLGRSRRWWGWWWWASEDAWGAHQWCRGRWGVCWRWWWWVGSTACCRCFEGVEKALPLTFRHRYSEGGHLLHQRWVVVVGGGWC